MAVEKVTDPPMNQIELKRLRDLGRYYLQSNKIDQALITFVTLLDKFPDDIGSIIILGDSYLMAGDPAAAKDLYQVALDLEPDRNDVQHRIQLAENTVSSESGIAGGFPPLHTQAVNRLIERLTGKPPSIDEEQINRAAELLDKTINSDSPASSVSEHLDEIDALLPAILELNIRQARSQGRADLAADLLDLQNSLIADNPGSLKNKNPVEFQSLMPASQKEVTRVILVGEPSFYSPYRQNVMAAALEQAGIIVEEDWESQPIPWVGFDLVIAHNPHTNPIFMKALAAWAGAGNPILADLDTDFRILSKARLSETRSFNALIQLADILTFPSTQAALRFSEEGYRALTIPDGWSQKNSLWQKDAPESAKFNIGIFSDAGKSEDVALIRRAAIRILREFPQTRLVLSGDPEVYPLFDSIPDTRRIYLPPTESDDYPYLIAQADIHLFPYQNNESARLVSDRKLMEAGVRKIAWIASSNPAVEEWNVGGFIARSMDDWYSHLKTLIQDHELRSNLAQEGHNKALEREASKMASIWASVVQKAIMVGKPKSDSREGE
jgi:glycosyltransferase involved in cell wall biosynthesis